MIVNVSCVFKKLFFLLATTKGFYILKLLKTAKPRYVTLLFFLVAFNANILYKKIEIF